MAAYTRDIIGILVSIVYVGVAIGVAEMLRKQLGWHVEFTRKVVHIAVGIWIIPTLYIFTHWYWAAVLPALAVIGNALSLRYGILPGIERGIRSDLGTIYFPISFVICIALFFDSAWPQAAAAGIMSMGLGDAAAAVVGKRFGRHHYRSLGARKTLEGSAAMFVVSAAAVLVTFIIFNAYSPDAAVTPHVSMRVVWVVTLAVAAIATALEAAFARGIDNLAVPVISSVAAYYILVALAGRPI